MDLQPMTQEEWDDVLVLIASQIQRDFRIHVPQTFDGVALVDFIVLLESRQRRIAHLGKLRGVGVGTVNSVLKIMAEKPIEPPWNIDAYWELATGDSDFIEKMNAVLPEHLKLKQPEARELLGVGVEAPAIPVEPEDDRSEAQRVFRLFTRACARHASTRLQGLADGDAAIDRLAERFVGLLADTLDKQP